MQRYWDGAAWAEQRRPAQAVTVVAPAAAPGNAYAITALVCGIVGAVLGLIPFTFWLAWILGVLAIVFGVIGRGRADREPAAGRRSTATAGLILGIVAIALGVVGAIVLTTLLNDVGNTFDDLDRCLENPDAAGCE